MEGLDDKDVPELLRDVRLGLEGLQGHIHYDAYQAEYRVYQDKFDNTKPMNQANLNMLGAKLWDLHCKIYKALGSGHAI